MYTQKMSSSKISVRRMTRDKVLVTTEGLVNVNIIKLRSKAYVALKISREDRIPSVLVTGRGKEELIGEWILIVKQNLITQMTTKIRSGYQNWIKG